MYASMDRHDKKLIYEPSETQPNTQQAHKIYRLNINSRDKTINNKKGWHHYHKI